MTDNMNDDLNTPLVGGGEPVSSVFMRIHDGAAYWPVALGVGIGAAVGFAVGFPTFMGCILVLFAVYMITVSGGYPGFKPSVRVMLLTGLTALGLASILGASYAVVRLELHDAAVDGYRSVVSSYEGDLSDAEKTAMIHELSSVYTLRGWEGVRERYIDLSHTPAAKLRMAERFAREYKASLRDCVAGLRSTDSYTVIKALNEAPTIYFRSDAAAAEKEMFDALGALQVSPDVRIRYATMQYLVQHKLAPVPK